MKKIYLFMAFFVAICFSLNAQNEIPQSNPGVTNAGFLTFDNSNHKVMTEGKIVKQNNHQKAKAVIFSETFGTGVLPVGWDTIDNTTGGVWEFNNPGGRSINTTTAANGFAIFDSDHYGNDGVTENADLITPEINCSALTVVKLSFEHYYYEYSNSTATVSVSGDNGSTWTVLQSWTTTGTANAEVAEYDISAVAAGHSQVKIKWNFVGDYAWYWAVDDVKVYEPEANDLAMQSIDINLAVTPGSVIPKATIINNGSVAQNNFNVQMKINSTVPYDQTVMVTSSLAPGATTQVTFPAWTAPLGAWTATAKTLLAGDANASNDSLQKSINVFSSLTTAFCFKNNLQPSKFYLQAPDMGFQDMGSAVSWYARGGSYIATGADTYSWYVLGSDFNLYSVDTLTGVTTLIGPLGIAPAFCSGLTYDKSTSTLYAAALNGSYPDFTFSLYTVSMSTGAATLVANGDSTGTFIEIACNSLGQMYAIEHRPSANGRLWSIDKTTAAFTLIGIDLGSISSANFQDIEFAPDDILYYTASMGTSGVLDGLYTINTSTGTATLLGGFPVANTQVVGVGIKTPYEPITNTEEFNERNFSLFPNPASDKISVISKNHETIKSVKVFSVSGQLVYEENVNFIATTINTSDFEEGYYIVQVLTDNGISTGKISVIR
ncbi:MAG TPA: T9SS type A sorting domain-containing protein [Bacteroidales bacterium]|nr:T9SS type A sorting domain-containing protein [Bacteroidales bacterium]